MARILARTDILGRRLRRIAQSCESDGGLEFTDNVYVLDTGVAFRLPFFHDSPFEEDEIPPQAKDVRDPRVSAILGGLIDRVVRPRNDDDFTPDAICLHLASGHWISQVSSAPHGTGGAGIYVVAGPLPDGDDLVDFRWEEHLPSKRVSVKEQQRERQESQPGSPD